MSFERTRLHSALLALIAAKLVGIVLFFDPLSYQSFDLPKSLLSRGASWLLAGLLVVSIWRFGLAIVPRSRIHLAVATVIAAQMLSALFAPNGYIALYGETDRYLGLTFSADMLVLYLASAVALRRPRDVAAVAGALGVAALGSVAYAVVQLSGHDPIAWSVDTRSRPFSTFGNPDMFGHFISVGIAASAGLLLFGWAHLHWRYRVSALVIAVALLAAAGVVATRGTLLGVGAALLVAIALVLFRPRAVAVAPRSLAAIGVASAFAIVLLLLVTPLGERARTTLAGVQTADRLSIYGSALAAVADRPIFGWGPDGFAVAYQRYRPANATTSTLPGNEPESSAHDWLLQSAVTTGVLGLIALLSLVALTTERLVRPGFAVAPEVAGPIAVAWAAYWANALVTVGSVSVDWFPWLAMGATAGLTGTRAVAPQLRLVPPASVAITLALALAAGASLVFAWSADRAALVASHALRAKITDVALASAKAAVAADPGRAEYWNLLGLTQEARRSWRDAGDSYERAAERSPQITTYTLNLARARGQQALAGDLGNGGGATAIAAARRGVDADPNNWEAHSVLAEVLNAFGQYNAALDEVVTAVSLSTTNPNNDTTAIYSSERADDAARARQDLETILDKKPTAPLAIALARLNIRMGDLHRAKLAAERALELAPADASARALVDMLTAQGVD